MTRSFKKETARDRHGSRKYRTAHGADSTRRPEPYSRERIFVAAHTRKGRGGGKIGVRAHFRAAPEKPLFR